MSDWLERHLARELAPVAAPDTLGIRLGLLPAKRWELPRLALAVAAAVVVIMGGGFAASRTAALDLRQGTAWQLHGTATAEFTSSGREAAAARPRREAGGDVPLRPAEGLRRTGAQLIRCDREAAPLLRINAVKATVLLAHAPSDMRGHALATTTEAGCHLCHSL